MLDYLEPRYHLASTLVTVNTDGVASMTPPAAGFHKTFSGYSISADGRYVVFATRSGDLVNGVVDDNGTYDVFLRDLATGTTELISRRGTFAGNGASVDPSISDDGRFIAFSSNATDLVRGVQDSNAGSDVFLFDRRVRRTRLISHIDENAKQTATFKDIDGAAQPGISSQARISGNGRYIVFASQANTLTPLSSKEHTPDHDIYLFDLMTAEVTRLTNSENGDSWSGYFEPSISADGSTVVYALYSLSAHDVIVHRVANGRARRLNPPDVRLAHDYIFTGDATAVLSRDSDTVAFIGQGPNGINALYVFDWRTEQAGDPIIDLKDYVPSTPSLSNDASLMVFNTSRELYDPHRAPRLLGISVFNRSSAKIEQLQRLGHTSSGPPYAAALTADGSQLLFVSDESDVSSTSDENGSFDLFVHTPSISGTVWRDRNGDRLRITEKAAGNIKVFLDLNANGIFDSSDAFTITDASGQYHFPRVPIGNHRVGIVAPEKTVATFPAPPSQFNIELAFDSRTGSSLQATLRRTADRWAQLILGDLSDSRGIDDLRITVKTRTIDGKSGTLGVAEPTGFRRGALLPYKAVLVLDSADVHSLPDDQLYTLALHEIAHALGFGIWKRKKLIRDERYVGRRAVAVYSQITGTSSGSIPLETRFGEGTRGSHWHGRDRLLGQEIMNGFVVADAPISAVTLAAMEDLGYLVNLAASDPLNEQDQRPACPENCLTFARDGATFHEISVGVGDNLMLDFAYTNEATLKGVVAQDTNRNGSLDSKDKKLSKRQVFLDLDLDRRWDVNEPSILTGKNGRYDFPNLAPGLYHVRQVRPFGFRAVLPEGSFKVLKVYLGDTLLTVDFLDRGRNA